MRKLLDKLHHSLILRVSFIYVVLAFIVIQFVNFAVSYLELPTTAVPITAILTVLVYLSVYQLFSVVEAVSGSDRSVIFWQMIWVYGPAFVLLIPVLLDIARMIFGLIDQGHTIVSTYQEELLFWLGLIAATIWMLISGPVARAWAIQNATDPDKLLRAEERLFAGLDIKKAEAHISPKMYYAFLTSVFGIIFLIAESMIGVLFEEATGIGGYIGASIAALGIAGIIYPAHKRVSKLIGLANSTGIEADVEDAKSATKEIANATVRYYKLEVPHGNKILFVVVVLTLIMAAVELYPYFINQ